MIQNLDFAAPLSYWRSFLQGGAVTLELTLIATVGGFTFGILCAIAGRSSRRWLVRLCGLYIEIVRNTSRIPSF